MREGIEPVYDINDWIASDPDWVDLLAGLREDDETDVFYPVQQEPTGGFPYVRYSSANRVWANTHWMHTDEIHYAMYFSSVSDSARAMNIIMDKVKAGDISAYVLNRWLKNHGEHDIMFEYHTLEWMTGGSSQPTQERGGAHARLVSFNVSYSPLTSLKDIS